MSLIVGKVIGICLMTFISVKLGLAELPSDIKPIQILGVGLLAGIGFTMSIFIGNLAFQDNQAILNGAKMSILFSSTVAAIAGYLVLYFSADKSTST